VALVIHEVAWRVSNDCHDEVDVIHGQRLGRVGGKSTVLSKTYEPNISLKLEAQKRVLESQCARTQLQQ